MTKRLVVTLLVLVLTVATMVALLVFDSASPVETLRGEVTYHQNSSPRTTRAFKTVWAQLENKAPASFTVDASKIVQIGQCVEFLRLERRFTRISHYQFVRYC